ncbi:MAG: NAD-binding protein [Oscillatoria sp. PMC 1051.18]|uniref:potassium channel family protein n=1 Tax=Oscillatoria salina TaxID=331517 RepID=UPI0013B5D8F5|nr:NAD-binding protein [Oscillatoria salina]MBZ8181739.1 TrkA family potassium uptake protein [Oscillatoria salina IIICB1]MEC4892383.1 NAD-binding protein [Oscillatoria sp. PMC 1050.18]MEC5031646.1 NAD-binding protein [Oscillatoria sp. PMC 1051.18]NET89896.1 TrkA family potassium uptake protein [Kamptonema sp. SIO1D9]
MYFIIVGGGAEGASLASLALELGHQVAMIESNSEQAQTLLQKFDNVKVFNADIAESGILEEVDIERADALFATTDDDSANLMAVFLAKEKKVKNIVTMLNNKGHQQMFERLGAKVLVNPETIIAQRLLDFLDREEDTSE